MNWLKVEYIQAQAKKGRRPALECSIEHWEQLAGATLKEITEALKNKLVSIGNSYCSLCYRYHDAEYEYCVYCPAKRAGENCYKAGSRFRAVLTTNFTWAEQPQAHPAAYPAFHREAGKMLKVLKDVHKKLYGEQNGTK